MKDYLIILAISHAVFYFSPKLSKVYRNLVGGSLVLPNRYTKGWKCAEIEIAKWCLIHLIGFGAPWIFGLKAMFRQEMFAPTVHLYMIIAFVAYILIGWTIIRSRAKSCLFLGEILEYIYKNKWLPTTVAAARVINIWLFVAILVIFLKK